MRCRTGLAGYSPIPIAYIGLALHRIIMRQPFGTTQKGQVLLALAGLTLGVGGGLGLKIMPVVFEPVLRAVLLWLSFMFHVHVHYNSSERSLFAIMLAIFGTLWALLLAYAFVREPARNRAIDNYLRRKNEIDSAKRAGFEPADDRSA